MIAIGCCMIVLALALAVFGVAFLRRAGLIALSPIANFSDWEMLFTLGWACIFCAGIVGLGALLAFSI